MFSESYLLLTVVLVLLSANPKYFVLSTTRNSGCLVWCGYWFYQQFPSGLVTQNPKRTILKPVITNNCSNYFCLKAAFPCEAIFLERLSNFLLPYHTFPVWAWHYIRYDIIVDGNAICIRSLCLLFPACSRTFGSVFGNRLGFQGSLDRTHSFVYSFASLIHPVRQWETRKKTCTDEVSTFERKLFRCPHAMKLSQLL